MSVDVRTSASIFFLSGLQDDIYGPDTRIWIWISPAGRGTPLAGYPAGGGKFRTGQDITEFSLCHTSPTYLVVACWPPEVILESTRRATAAPSTKVFHHRQGFCSLCFSSSFFNNNSHRPSAKRPILTEHSKPSR